MSDVPHSEGENSEIEKTVIDEVTQDPRSELEVLKEAYHQLQTEMNAHIEKSKSDQLYRLAEFDNYRKRALKEQSDLIKFGPEKVLLHLVGIMDNFERALAAELSSNTSDSFRKGVELIASELRSLFEKFQVTEIRSEGQMFDPNIHEALTSEEVSDVPAGQVVRVFRKAYKFHDKVLRVGQVVVAREPGA